MLILCLNSRTPAFDKKETKKLKLKQKQQKLTRTCDTSLIVVMNQQAYVKWFVCKATLTLYIFKRVLSCDLKTVR